MTYVELKKIAEKNDTISTKLYICSFISCKEDRMKQARITLVTNIFRRYVVTEWLDYEYGQFVRQKSFQDKDLAAAYAWQLFEELE